MRHIAVLSNVIKKLLIAANDVYFGRPRVLNEGLQTRRRYIAHVWLMRMGVPIGLVAVGLSALDSHFDLRTIVSIRFLVSAGLIMLAALAASYGMGRLFWKLGLWYDPDRQNGG